MHVHCGCATNTSVRPSADGTSGLSAGQRIGAVASAPGRFCHAQMVHSPQPTVPSQAVATNHTQRRAFRTGLRSDAEQLLESMIPVFCKQGAGLARSTVCSAS